MSQTKNSNDNTKTKDPKIHLLAGGIAGFVESSICHPLDTIKTRMQLRRQQTSLEALRARSSLYEPSSLSKTITQAATTTTSRTTIGTVSASLSPIGTARRIIVREGFWGFYKGLSAVYMGIVPKMAIRFLSFEQYKDILHEILFHEKSDSDSSAQSNSSKSKIQTSSSSSIWNTTGINFMAGLASGITEALLIVTPAEVCKIRMQSQHHSLMDPPSNPLWKQQQSRRKYTHVFQTATTIVRDEGVGALYKGVLPTMLRQGCNQAVNFTAYHFLKGRVLEYQQVTQLDSWQSMVLGGISGGLGPCVNNPLDVVKTRMQKQVIQNGRKPKYQGILQSCHVIAKEEGIVSLWKGLTPRLMRIMPGQAITFMTYEAVSSALTSS
eukprot:CAMPEP_0184857844 /NCGR_PEP_ID=MMETSP0580-20130426/2990_1 /TAXON_ID=1118495 /ORGANISM="Dactyliosolen fragilissimus" /LENGTH=380 /DNA_ID=CAMNT_0027353675 /DNA_START=27 /DNA_END=1169 /DNA_ORIENTATION=-